MGRPDEAGKLAVMLADAPSYLTGQILTLDGDLDITGSVVIHIIFRIFFSQFPLYDNIRIYLYTYYVLILSVTYQDPHRNFLSTAAPTAISELLFFEHSFNCSVFFI